MENKIKNICLRCGIDKKDKSQLGNGCSVYGTYYNRHFWGIWRGKTYKIKLHEIEKNDNKL